MKLPSRLIAWFVAIGTSSSTFATNAVDQVQRQQDENNNNDFFETSIRLQVDDMTRHYSYFGAKRTASIHTSDMNDAAVWRTQRIHNGRGNPNLKLDDASFELVECPTKLSTKDFYNLQSGKDSALKKTYYEEVATFVKDKLGSDECVVFHHQVRNTAKNGEGGVQGYATSAPHTDTSAVSGDQQALNLAPGNPNDYERYTYVNLWRNIADLPIENDHLAMLDERTTVKPDDYIQNDLYLEGDYTLVQNTLSARHADNHNWYHFPEMHKDEAILFKQMDSDWTKTGRNCFHMSANDPNVQNYAPRESIEVRAFCYWKKTKDGLNSMPTKENTNADLIKDPLKVAEEMSCESVSLFERIRRYFFPKKEAEKYGGKPEYYFDRFLGAVNYFPSWPAASKDWVKSIMMDHEDQPVEGIATITAALVDDEGNYQKTKSFSSSEKKEIVDYLLSNEIFMEAARKQFGSVLETRKSESHQEVRDSYIDVKYVE